MSDIVYTWSFRRNDSQDSNYNSYFDVWTRVSPRKTVYLKTSMLDKLDNFLTEQLGVDKFLVVNDESHTRVWIWQGLDAIALDDLNGKSN